MKPCFLISCLFLVVFCGCGKNEKDKVVIHVGKDKVTLNMLEDRLKNAPSTLQDYMNTVEAPDGTKHKKKIKNEEGVYFEEFGHTSDANDYFHIEVLNNSYNSYISGYRKVSFKMMPRTRVKRKNMM